MLTAFIVIVFGTLAQPLFLALSGGASLPAWDVAAGVSKARAAAQDEQGTGAGRGSGVVRGAAGARGVGGGGVGVVRGGVHVALLSSPVLA